jgi:hypothetical protein
MEQKGSLKKMASKKIKEKLRSRGYAPDKVETFDRTQLLISMAKVMAALTPDPVVAEEELDAVCSRWFCDCSSHMSPSIR